MRTVPVLTARAAADLICDGAVVTVSSSSGLGCPDATLQGIGERFQQTGSPRNLTSVHPIAAGDMYGIRGIDHLAIPGLLSKVIAGSYPSGPSKAEPPQIWQMIERDEIQAYNLPSGVLFQMHRAGATGQPGVFTKVGLDTFVDPRHQGGRMNTATTDDLVEVTKVKDREYLFYPAIEPDVAIIRATTADAQGNLTYEEEGSALGALDQAYAAHNRGGLVIAQVKRLADAGALDPQAVRVPGVLIDVIVVDEAQLQTTATPYDPAISGQVRRSLDVIEPAPWGLEKIIARRAALELDHQAIDAGAQFLVSPGLSHEVVEAGRAGGVTVLPGVVTATELMAALDLGVTVVKFFPASTFGGAVALRALAAPFADVHFMPTGGIRPNNLSEYLAIPAVMAVGGTWITTPQLLAKGDFAAISQLAGDAIKAVAEHRPPTTTSARTAS